MKLMQLFVSAVIYVFFLLTFTYLVVFFGGSVVSQVMVLPEMLKTIDQGASHLALPFLPAGLSNALLILAFGLQHSLMARSGFKNIITRWIPGPLERSVYVLFTCLVLCWWYLAWQPMTHQLWYVSGALATLLQILFFLGATLVLWSTFMISHGQLFGIAQAWRHYRGIADDTDTFVTPSLYKYTRHPMYLGILVVLWSTPAMTSGHFIAASLLSIYVFIGMGYEERDLLARFGDAYRDYMKKVPQILPIGFRQ